MVTMRRSSFLLGLAAAPLLAACSTSEAGTGSASDGGSTSGGDAGAFPVTLEHVYGTTEIPAKPARVVTIGWMTHDIVAALGTAPVGVSTSWGGDEEGFNPWFRTQVEGVLSAELPTILTEEEGPDYEQILSLMPDVILAPHSGITEVQYERLTEIAPTVAYREGAWSSGTWQDLTGIVATALGESEKGDSLIAETEKGITEAAAQYPRLDGASFIYSLALSAADGGTEMGVYVSGDPRVSLLHAFGMVDSPALAAASEGADADTFNVAVSLEELDTVEADVLVAWSNSAEDTQYSLEHPLYSRWAPIAGGHYFITEDPVMGMATSGPSVLSIPWAIEEGYVEGISQALEGDAVVRPAE
ncbi:MULTISPECIES: ABC transporter substrate-binding protein [Brachybacterium]|uniref:ABC transporter substrate-binding protein n=1 Tax=Brachybacterium TaxID=43668 RepID=UPI000DF4367F|nr:MULTISPECIES: ABC transporter substrate-binding protein [Brachybacterium]RCS65500.1 iron siderophore-binding protein [Brachybacterium sp. JB7]RCS69653.1 iron siderophore-binding protein [Brachybacterium alimentarium]RCS77040.1 iron siderophore-binding protein [Brachybacterium alimentarium]RCS78904.1 iron siderophore-binding protein [Brachybacterium alimentarium]